MRLTRYGEYKASGVHWLGQVPAHWTVLPIRFAARLESGHTPSRSRPDWWEDCCIPWFTLADVAQIRRGGAEVIFDTKEKVSELGLQNSSARRLPAGTVMLSRTASVGFAAIAGVEMATSQDFANWVCGPLLQSRFLLYAFRAMRGEFSRLMMGSTHNTIYMPDIAALRFALPSLDEQDGVVAFLDRETAKIDALIAEQEKLIALLAEKRQASISQAVTKGLDPKALMKDSGVAWLGEVPAHWGVCALRRVVVDIEQGWSPECYAREAEAGEWGVLKAGCLNGGVFRPSENKALPPELEPDGIYEVRVGDVLMSRASGSPELVGSTALVTATRPGLMLSDKIFRLRLQAAMKPRYFVIALNSRALRFQIENALSGGNGMANNLPQSNLLTFSMPVPPPAEQEAIADSVDAETDKLDTLRAKSERAITLLKERRAALIAAAVTGQIDVRGAVPASATTPMELTA